MSSTWLLDERGARALEYNIALYDPEPRRWPRIERIHPVAIVADGTIVPGALHRQVTGTIAAHNAWLHMDNRPSGPGHQQSPDSWGRRREVSRA